MIKKILCWAVLCGLTSVLSAQSEYWQQFVQYEIQVKLDDQKHFLHGKETLYYTNNAPETLTELYIHLWPNAYKDNTTAFAKQKLDEGSKGFHFAKEKNRGYIDSLEFKVDGQKVEWEFHEGNWDIARITLKRPLPKGETLVLTTPFRVKIPLSYSRLGHVKQQYQITQWYPKPAVYDKNGWHAMPYLNQGEFYSEFGTYDVSIELPRNYVLGATGDMAEDDIEEQWLAERERLSKELLELPKEEAEFPREFAPDEFKTLHFHQENVHDFAWFCDQDYYRTRSITEVPYTGTEVECIALFTNLERDYWKNIANPALEKSIVVYSKLNGNYPYKHVTAVEGALSAGAGMEYPNITVVSANDSEETLEQVIMHEVGHNWYYGMLGSDERAHPWMDEGLNSYMENRYWQEIHQDSLNMIPRGLQKAMGLDLTHSRLQEEGYRFSAGENADPPIEFHAAEYSDVTYGTVVYMKAARAFHYLEGFLGREVIDLCFQSYFAEWKFKHPAPEDMQAVFEKVAKQDLDWFFGPYLNGTEKIDFTISKIEGNRITVKNKSGIALPCPINLLDKDGNILETRWTPVFEKTANLEMGTSDFHRAVVDEESWMPEFREGNNYRRNSKFLPKVKGPKLSFLYKFPQPDKFNLGVFPALGYNTTDGVMLGVGVHHGFYPKSKVEFHALPMIGLKEFELTGSFGFTYRWLPQKHFRKIELHSRTSLFADLLSSRNFLEFYFQKSRPRSPIDQKLTLNLFHFDNRNNIGEYFSPAFGNVVYDFDLKKPFYDVHLSGEAGLNIPNETFRTSLTARYHQQLGKKYHFEVRGFVGGFLKDTNVPIPFRYGLNGSGDPFGQNILLDRNGNVNWLNRQIVTDHGGFRSIQSNRFGSGIATAGITSGTFTSLLSLYADVGTGQVIAGSGYDFFYTSGLQINFPGDVLKVYFPIAGSQFADGVVGSGNEFGQNISFSLTFKSLDSYLPK